MTIRIETVERTILEQIKFIDFMLREMKNRNKNLEDTLYMSYAKLIGIKKPYEEVIYKLRRTKIEFDQYLKIIRQKMIEEYKARALERNQQ